MSRVTAPRSTSPRVRVVEVRAFERPVPLRMPFRLGTASIDELSTIHVRVDLESGGRRVRGIGASTLSPLWFDKSATVDVGDKRDALLTSVALAATGYQGAGQGTAWELHRAVQPAIHVACAERAIPELTSSFGVAVIDSAIVDALCRANALTFHAALRSDLFGFGAVPWLGRRARTRLSIRHTIGMADPLLASEVRSPLEDGLPEALDQIVRTSGIRWFKVKIGADIDADLERLGSVQEVLHSGLGNDYGVVLDGNEAFADLGAFLPLLERLANHGALRHLYERLHWIEQPVARDSSFGDGVDAAVRAARRYRPLILDESDSSDDTVDRALEVGYSGVSAKNCKGVFRTLHSARTLYAHPGSVLAAEDLTLPAIGPLHQDTAVVASLGVPHVERNGHHYVRGLSFLPVADQRTALRDYPSLYESVDGLVRLRVRDGTIDVTELTAAPYGVASPPDLSTMTELRLPSDVP